MIELLKEEINQLYLIQEANNRNLKQLYKQSKTIQNKTHRSFIFVLDNK
jgi:hypothetical protein